MVEPFLKTVSLDRRMARGVAWMALFKLADRSVGLLSTIILARLLAPSDFGLVAMAMSVVALLELMSAFGFDIALIQRSHLEREHYDTAWTFNVALHGGMAALLLTLSAPAAAFYREPQLELILVVLAVGAAVQGLENIGVVAFRRDLDFRREFRFLALKRVAMFTVTVTLAIAFRSYWALVAGVVVGKALSVCISYMAHPFRPQFSLSRRVELFNFSKWLFLSNCIHLLQNKSLDFILGRTVGAHGLGVYSVALEIAVLPSTELVAPINRAVFPGYARSTENLAQLRLRFLDVFSIIALIAFPAALGLASVAEPAVLVLLGNKWSETIPLVQLIAVAGLVGALQSNLHLLVIAMGRPRAITISSAIVLAAALPVFIIAPLHYGVMGAAWAFVFFALLSLTAIHVVFFHVSGIRVMPYLARLWRPVLASVVLAVAVDAMDSAALANVPNVLRLFWLILTGALTYAVSVCLLWLACGRPSGGEARMVELLSEVASRMRLRPSPRSQ